MEWIAWLARMHTWILQKKKVGRSHYLHLLGGHARLLSLFYQESRESPDDPGYQESPSGRPILETGSPEDQGLEDMRLLSKASTSNHGLFWRGYQRKLCSEIVSHWPHMLRGKSKCIHRMRQQKWFPMFIHTCGSILAGLPTLTSPPLDAMEARAAPVSRKAMKSFVACNERMPFQFQFHDPLGGDVV